MTRQSSRANRQSSRANRQSPTTNRQSSIVNRQSPMLADLDEKDRKLRTDCEHQLLRHIIDRLREDQLEPEQFHKYAQAYCELKKHDVAAEKNLAALRPPLPKGPPATHQGHSSSTPAAGPFAAPFGRKDDGTPYTRSEFRRGLTDSIADLYGLSSLEAPTANTARPPAGSTDHDSNDGASDPDQQQTISVTSAQVLPADAPTTSTPCSAHQAGGQTASAAAQSRDPP